MKREEVLLRVNEDTEQLEVVKGKLVHGLYCRGTISNSNLVHCDDPSNFYFEDMDGNYMDDCYYLEGTLVPVKIVRDDNEMSEM